MKKLVSNQLTPNFSFRDSLYCLVQIARIFSKKSLDFTEYFETSHYVLTNGARTALGQIIEIVKPDKKKKIGLPAFLCAVVAVPFLSRGYTIEWIDTDENGLISVDDFQKKSNLISMVVVPHIFGQKAPIEKIFKLAQEKNIFVIEDGAHLFDTNSDFCDAKILSFGREKDVSCVSGGALLWKNSSPYHESFKQIRLPSPSWTWTVKHLFQPFLLSFSLPLWNIGSIGKVFAYVMKKSKILPRAVSLSEKKGIEDFPIGCMPFPMQRVLLYQFKRRRVRMRHREALALKWKEVLTLIFHEGTIAPLRNNFRVLFKTSNAQHIRERMKPFGFDLYEWNGVPLSPEGVILQNFGYKKGMCPKAEVYAQNYITFPTNIRTRIKDIEYFSHLWMLLHQ